MVNDEENKIAQIVHPGGYVYYFKPKPYLITPKNIGDIPLEHITYNIEIKTQIPYR